MITITVSSVPAAPSSRCNTAANSATTLMISAMIGQRIQNLPLGTPPSQGPAIRSISSVATIANPIKVRPSRGPAVTLVAALSIVATW